jgi:hypothetical protein
VFVRLLRSHISSPACRFGHNKQQCAQTPRSRPSLQRPCWAQCGHTMGSLTQFCLFRLLRLSRNHSNAKRQLPCGYVPVASELYDFLQVRQQAKTPCGRSGRGQTQMQLQTKRQSPTQSQKAPRSCRRRCSCRRRPIPRLGQVLRNLGRAH